MCLLALLLCHFFCSCVAFFAFSLDPLLYPQLYLTVSMHSTEQHQLGLLLSLYLSPTAKAGAVVCNYDLQHGPPWLLLLSFIVNRVLLVYHAVLLLCHSYHPAHAIQIPSTAPPSDTINMWTTHSNILNPTSSPPIAISYSYVRYHLSLIHI